MPTGQYEDFAACVADQRKEGKSLEAAQRICGALERDAQKSAGMLVLTKSDEKRYTLGVVYEPDAVDTQGEFAKAEDIESAAWGFLSRLQMVAKVSGDLLEAFRTVEEYPDGVSVDITEVEGELSKAGVLDDQHLQVGEPLGSVVESYLAPTDLSIGGQEVKKGSWLLGVVWTPEMFARIKTGERTGLSMYGRAERR